MTLRAAFLQELVRWSAIAWLTLHSGMPVWAQEAATQNFVVTGLTQQMADGVSQACEQAYAQHWRDWFGSEPKPMPRPAPVSIRLGDPNKTSGGSTGLFVIDGAFVGADGSWMMSPGWAYDLVPHEVMHMVLCYGLSWNSPRWLDEGIAANCEDARGQSNWYNSAQQVVARRQQIPLRHLTQRQVEFPEAIDYIQGTTMVSMLLERGEGRSDLIRFACTLRDRGLDAACQSVYGRTPEELDAEWAQWVRSHPGNSTNQRIIGRRSYQFCPNGKCWQQVDDGWSSGGGQYVIQQPAVQQPVQQPTQVESTAEVRAKWEAFIAATIDAKLAEIKQCECDHSNLATKVEVAELRQQVLALSNSTTDISNAVTANNALLNENVIAMEANPAYVPPTPEQQATAIEPFLKHAATVTLLDGTTKTQTKPLSEPLDFIQHQRGLK
jgi:hypothetical protein